jgi:hypothetical protein
VPWCVVTHGARGFRPPRPNSCPWIAACMCGCHAADLIPFSALSHPGPVCLITLDRDHFLYACRLIMLTRLLIVTVEEPTCMHPMIRPGPAYMITPLHQKTKQQPASARVHRPVRERRMEPVSSTGQRGLARVVAVDRRTAISTLLLLTHVTHTYMTVNVRTTPPSTIKRERRGQLSLQNTLTACMRRPACTSFFLNTRGSQRTQSWHYRKNTVTIQPKTQYLL